MRRSSRFPLGQLVPAERRAAGGMLACALLLAMAGIHEARAGEGWVTLFDGKTLDGWVQRNGTASYRVRDGAIIGRTSEGSPNSFLTTEQDYGDFELELEFEVKLDDPLNSGVQIRSRIRPRSTGDGADEQAGRVFGPQVEIEASPGLAGFIYGEATGRGWLTPKERLAPHEQFRNGAWNHYRIVARGPRIRTWLNGQPIEDLTDEGPTGPTQGASSACRCMASSGAAAPTKWPGAACACASCRPRSNPAPRRSRALRAERG